MTFVWWLRMMVQRLDGLAFFCCRAECCGICHWQQMQLADTKLLSPSRTNKIQMTCFSTSQRTLKRVLGQPGEFSICYILSNLVYWKVCLQTGGQFFFFLMMWTITSSLIRDSCSRSYFFRAVKAAVALSARPAWVCVILKKSSIASVTNNRYSWELWC